jgi:hypothetical protein
LIIYSAHITNRLQYIVDTLFEADVILTDNVNEYKASSLFKLNYSSTTIHDDEVWIKPHSLLFQTKIEVQTIDCFEWNGLTAFFKTEGTIAFDVLAASFYLISRYEEYLPHEKDEHARYSHTNSTAYKNNFLYLPLVDLWLKKIKEVIRSLAIHNSQFTFIPTYDIDIAYQYLHHSVIKNVFIFYKELLKGNFTAVVEQGNVYSGWKQDPFDTFNWLDALHKKHKLQPVYFLLTLLRKGKFDRNVLATKKAIKNLYQRLAEQYVTGLHPSYKSSEDVSNELLLKERNTLSNIIQHPITISRNHYLRFIVPQTYRTLIQQGFTDDYSMAYGSINGFRASTSKAFYWFDVEKNESTELLIHPFSFMEANSIFHQKNTVQQAYAEMMQHYEIIQSVNGTFISLFHNHFLTEQPEWIEWRKMYEQFLAAVSV